MHQKYKTVSHNKSEKENYFDAFENYYFGNIFRNAILYLLFHFPVGTKPTN